MSDRLRVSISRRELVWLLDGLEAIIEEFKYDGGLMLAEDYIALENKLRTRLAAHDGAPSYLLPAGRFGGTP